MPCTCNPFLDCSCDEYETRPGADGAGNSDDTRHGFRIQERDPPMPRSWLRARGSAVVQWLDNPHEPGCTIPSNSLTFQQIQQDSLLREAPLSLPSGLVLPDEISSTQLGAYIMAEFDSTTWYGVTAPSLIVLHDIERERPADEEAQRNPHISEISIGLYARDHALESLRYVFVVGVVNSQTRTFVKSVLNASWPPTVQPQCWHYGSQEYEEILGTRIGRTVGYLVLGAFARGSHRIARILLWSHTFAELLQIRFDIEPIPDE